MNNKKNILRRVYLLYFISVLAALAVLVKVGVLQFVEGHIWKQKAENFTVAYRTIDAVRGNIYDAGGSLLATSLPIYEIRWDPNAEAITASVFDEHIDTLSTSLANLFPKRNAFQWKQYLINARKEGERYLLIARNVQYDELKKLRNFPLFERGRYKGGFLYMQQNRREKPFRLLAARTIGYERPGVTPVGLEGAYSNHLRGVSGKRLMKKIMGGVWMPINDENELEPENGSDIYTTIDINIQDVAESALLKQLKKHDAEHGCVVLMEVETGEVRAIANLSRNTDGSYSEKYNYAIGASTEPGSTFKLASYMAALEDGYINLDQKVETGNGSYQFYDLTMEDSKEGGYGELTIEEAFAVSSNIAIAKLIDKYYRAKPQSFVDQLRSMRLHLPLGIEIAGEGQPLIKSADDETWSGITLPWMSHGYEVQLTPLQILAFYNAVANNGKMMKPMFVRSVRKGNELVEQYEPVVLNNQIASSETMKKARKLLEAVVEEGTAVNLKDAHYSIAGKTGTAQIANSKYGYHSDHGVSYQASFCGYFPADKPRYSCIVVVNAPSRNVYYGNLVAGPIFKEIADKVYSTRIEMHDEFKPLPIASNTRIPVAKNSHYKDLKTVYESIGVHYVPQADEMDWAITKTLKDSVLVEPIQLPEALVPNVTGMNPQDAVYVLENLGLSVKLRGRGAVKKQSIMPGASIQEGKTIILELA